MKLYMGVLTVSIGAAIALANVDMRPEEQFVEAPSFNAIPPAAAPLEVDPEPELTTSTLPVWSGDEPTEPSLAVAPVQLRMPSLSLDVAVEPVGVDDDGLFDVPHVEQVGWYRYGPSPGDPGSAVLAAHVDFNGQAGAFFELRKMEVGDVFHLDYQDGSTKTFEVVGHTLYEKTSLPADDLFRRNGPSVLHLATCGGTFDPESRSYRANRVVSAIPKA